MTGIATSLGLHALTAGGVAAAVVAGLIGDIPINEPTTDLTISAVVNQPEIHAAVTIDLPPAPDPIVPNGEEVLAGISDPRWQALVEPVPKEEIESAKVFVSTELMRIAREAEQRTADENLERLAALGSTLTAVSTDKAVGEINTQLSRVLGTEERAQRPADGKVAGEFDFATAQLHDVLRAKNEQGAFIFTAILVDSAGRRFESPMSASEGETAYRTMQLIKSNPLLERVYRGVVMSMLDQVLKGAQ